MKSQTFTSFMNVLLLSISLCITEMVNQACDVFNDEKKETKEKTAEIAYDVLNPIYIFK